uniref:Uncharacterized protein n=1 Tax=Solanum lycopersicum TaxID=4081 RepID=K4BZV4_SOLLC
MQTLSFEELEISNDGSPAFTSAFLFNSLLDFFAVGSTIITSTCSVICSAAFSKELYTILYVTRFVAAGIRPCVSSFGADQLDERSRNYVSHLDKFFTLFNLSVTVGATIDFPAVVNI